MHSETARASDALFSIPPDLPRDGWVKAGMGFNAAGGDFDTFDSWSAQAGNYNAADCRDTWRSFKPGKGVGAGSLFGMARDAGWQEGHPSPRPAPAQTRKAEPQATPRAGMSPSEIFARCEPATNQHGYIAAKKAQGVPLDSLRVVPQGDALRIAGQNMAGFLMVPAYAPDGTLQSAQFIPPPGGGKKVNLPGASMAGAAFTLGLPDGPAHLCEGIGAAWAVWQSTGQRAVVCFGWGNVRRVAEGMRERDPNAKLILVPDSGKEQDAAKIATDIRAAVVAMPPGWPDNSDVHDLMQRDGFDVLAALLESAKEPPIVYPLSVAFADELPDEYVPPDELVQGVLTAGDGTVLYGDSNSGKTFLVIDMACAVARGVPWMGRQTEPGLVVYLAAESPASVRGRLQAYQKHHGVRVPNFAIVQSPIDLFDGDADTSKVIKLVRMLEAKSGQPVRLIVGDTLARLSAGANENAGQDMGLVVRRFDRIRTECKAHFLLIHHSGKAAAAGARGWSGIRAAVDTEIEVTDSPAGRCCEITKQRDLPTKGDRIGFRLDVVTLGHTKWGAPATSCVVVPSDAPVKQTNKRMGECEGAVVEFLAAHRIGIKKAELAKHFDGRYERANVYRAVRTLLTAQAIHEAAGMVCIAEVAK
jgi:putative DNA primase/helicase